MKDGVNPLRPSHIECTGLCDEWSVVAGSITVLVVGSEPERLRPPPVGIRTWSPRHTPLMVRELVWVAHDVLGSCLQ
jgi:hypothetical protein